MFGPAWFIGIFLALCTGLSVYEAAHMLFPAMERRLAPGESVVPEMETGRRAMPTVKALTSIAVVIGLGIITLTTAGTALATGAVAATGILAALLIGTFAARSIDLAVARAIALTLSVAWGAMPWVVVWQVYTLGEHARYVFLVMAITWSGDTGGYFGGRYLGGKIFGDRKMAPRISPKKTWEGALSGLILSVVAAWLLNLIFLNNLGSFELITAAAVFGGIAAQLGDLVESSLKRFAGIKDSGAIIPGHGGFLDRVDGILFAAPVVWVIVHYFG
jgi:phosphatidate cytidylyltransferase